MCIQSQYVISEWITIIGYSTHEQTKKAVSREMKGRTFPTLLTMGIPYITLNQPSRNNSLSTNNLRKIDQYGVLGNYRIYLAICWVIFTQIKATVQWNVSPVGGFGLWPRVFDKKCFSVYWNSTKLSLNGDVFTY